MPNLSSGATRCRRSCLPGFDMRFFVFDTLSIEQKTQNILLRFGSQYDFVKNRVVKLADFAAENLVRVNFLNFLKAIEIDIFFAR